MIMKKRYWQPALAHMHNMYTHMLALTCTTVLLLYSFFTGAIETLQEGVDGDEEGLLAANPCTGMLSLRLHVDGKSGRVNEVVFLADTLVGGLLVLQSACCSCILVHWLIHC